MLNFTTLFYSNYLAKGLSLYRSLKNVSNDFHLYIFAMDDVAYDILCHYKLDSATIIHINALEKYYPALFSVKNIRNAGEYSWTCKGPSLLYCFEYYKLSNCTYLDADLYFFSNPAVLFSEHPNYDVLLTKHNYTEEYDLEKTNGRYCAQFMSFKATDNGMAILHWWTDLCIEWCYARQESGRFGDQKYLDRFPTEWKNVYDVEHIGIIAPWNVQQYIVNNEKGIVKVQSAEQNQNLIFYHFHFLRNSDFGRINEFYIGPYKLSKSVLKLIYRPYINNLRKIDREVREMGFICDVLGSANQIHFSILRLCAHWLKNSWKENKKMWKRR